MEFIKHKKQGDIYAVKRAYMINGISYLSVQDSQTKKTYEIKERQVNHFFVKHKPGFLKRIRLILKLYK